MSSDIYDTILNTECLVFNTGSVICVPAVKYTSKCNPDYTYWPHDQHTCRISLGSWSHTGEEIDVHLDGSGVCYYLLLLLTNYLTYYKTAMINLFFTYFF